MCVVWRFGVVCSLASFLNEVTKYQQEDMVGFPWSEKCCFLFLPFRVANLEQTNVISS